MLLSCKEIVGRIQTVHTTISPSYSFMTASFLSSASFQMNAHHLLTLISAEYRGLVVCYDFSKPLQCVEQG